jgi:hypothetical protein
MRGDLRSAEVVDARRPSVGGVAWSGDHATTVVEVVDAAAERRPSVAQGGGFAEPWEMMGEIVGSPGGAKESVVPPGLGPFLGSTYPRVPQSLHPGLPSVAAPRLHRLV